MFVSISSKTATKIQHHSVGRGRITKLSEWTTLIMNYEFYNFKMKFVMIEHRLNAHHYVGSLNLSIHRSLGACTLSYIKYNRFIHSVYETCLRSTSVRCVMFTRATLSLFPMHVHPFEVFTHSLQPPPSVGFHGIVKVGSQSPNPNRQPSMNLCV